MPEPKARILHVEDDGSLQKLVKISLERLGGFTVRTAVDCAEAVALARESGADLLLLDLDLPGDDGAATLAALREVPGMGEIPAIFLTAANAATRDRLLALGARAVLGKPFRPRALLAAIQRVLAGGS